MCWYLVSSQDETAKGKKIAMWNVKRRDTRIQNHRRKSKIHFCHSETAALSTHMIWMSLELDCSETEEFVIIPYPLVGVCVYVLVCVFVWVWEGESLRGIMTINWSGWNKWPGADWDVTESDTYGRWMWRRKERLAIWCGRCCFLAQLRVSFNCIILLVFEKHLIESNFFFFIYSVICRPSALLLLNTRDTGSVLHILTPVN